MNVEKGYGYDEQDVPAYDGARPKYGTQLIMRVLVCGATGFIGRNLVEQLSDIKSVEVVAHWHSKPPFALEVSGRPVEWRRGDLCRKEDVRRILEGIEVVIQGAAVTSGSKDITERPVVHICENAVMNSYLLSEAHLRSVKQFIFMSCSVMYGAGLGPQGEEDVKIEKITKTYFGAAHTKLYIEKLLEFYSSIGNMKTTALRHSNIYGPHDKFDEERSHFFGATVGKVCRAQNEIEIWGDGKEKRDLLYIDDLVDVVKRILKGQKNHFEIYNVGSGKAYTVREVVEEIVKISGKDLKIVYNTDKPHIRESIEIDCTKLQEDLNWSPRVGLREGISSTLEWYSREVSNKISNEDSAN